jgi:two-component system sensor histidine kinase/response regulator
LPVAQLLKTIKLKMNSKNPEEQLNTDAFGIAVKKRSDKLMDYFLVGFFLTGLVFAEFYDTWLIAFGVGGLCLTAYYVCKIGLPGSNLYQYVISTILGVFMAQYIYQMHGMLEMHFFAFIGSAILITYQNWRLQIPIMLVVVIHHGAFSYLQNIGVEGVYFTQLDNFDLQTFIIHVVLAGVIFFICGLWGYQLKKYTKKYINQSHQMGLLQKQVAITLERKQNAEELEKAYIKAEKARLEAEYANQNLEIKNKELEQFAYVASHDLQEPLRSILSFAELFEEQYKGKLDAKADKYLGYIMQSTGRMKILINDLLDYSRIGNKKELQKIDCNTILQEVKADMHKTITDEQAVIETTELPVIEGYSTEIKQLFQNLISNAIKFRKKGTIPRIKISAHQDNTCWTFGVQDNGIGIAKEHMDRVFTIFQRLHTKKEYEGSGIGLAHCKKIIGLHKGKIWIESTPGEGTTFYFNIPQFNNYSRTA